jgi:Cof subfamily protein (haloacid dehalogenase superfamily)
MAGQTLVRLLIADVDGTLVTPEKALTPRAIDAVQELNRAGIAFAITSGRPPRGMRMLVEPLGIVTPVAGFNGGVFARPDMEVTETRPLPADVAAIALKTILAHGLDAWVYTATEWFARGPDGPHARKEARTVQFDATIVADFPEEVVTRAVKIVGISDSDAGMTEAEAALQSAVGARASATRSQPYYLDVTHPRANKGAVADELARTLGIPHEQIATIGDMPNDIMMFRRSGISIAMGNANDAVRQAADTVTDSNADDGFANAVQKFILPRAPQGGRQADGSRQTGKQ